MTGGEAFEPFGQGGVYPALAQKTAQEGVFL
jgi:hypothetical protein